MGWALLVARAWGVVLMAVGVGLVFRTSVVAQHPPFHAGWGRISGWIFLDGLAILAGVLLTLPGWARKWALAVDA